VNHPHFKLVSENIISTYMISFNIAFACVQYYRYKNRPHMTFDDVGALEDQEFDLHPDNTGTLEYSTKLVLIFVLSFDWYLENN
jgi:hypothetical protein